MLLVIPPSFSSSLPPYPLTCRTIILYTGFITSKGKDSETGASTSRGDLGAALEEMEGGLLTTEDKDVARGEHADPTSVGMELAALEAGAGFESVLCPWRFEVSGFEQSGIHQHGKLDSFSVQLLPNRAGPSPCPVVIRRWEDFTALRALLSESHKGAILPGLPQHGSITQGSLELFLHQCSQNTIINEVAPLADSQVGVIKLTDVLRDFGVLEGEGEWDARYQARRFLGSTINAVQGGNRRVVDAVARQMSKNNIKKDVVPERYQALYSYVDMLEATLCEARRVREDVLAEHASMVAALDDVGQAFSDLSEVEAGRVTTDTSPPGRRRTASFTASLGLSLNSPPPALREHSHTDTALKDDLKSVSDLTGSLVACSAPSSAVGLAASTSRGVISVPDAEKEVMTVMALHLSTLPYVRGILYHIKSLETALAKKRRAVDELSAKNVQKVPAQRGGDGGGEAGSGSSTALPRNGSMNADPRVGQQLETLSEEAEELSRSLAVTDLEFRTDWERYKKQFAKVWV